LDLDGGTAGAHVHAPAPQPDVVLWVSAAQDDFIARRRQGVFDHAAWDKDTIVLLVDPGTRLAEHIAALRGHHFDPGPLQDFQRCLVDAFYVFISERLVPAPFQTRRHNVGSTTLKPLVPSFPTHASSQKCFLLSHGSHRVLSL